MHELAFDSFGSRKYLTADEIDRFVQQSNKNSLEVHAFCSIIAYTGCRISEALSFTQQNIDFSSRQAIIKCLKKRGKAVFRAVPLPAPILKLFKRWFSRRTTSNERLWPWCRMTGYRRIRETMISAGIVGSHASPKGLRHGFGVRAVQSNIPLNLIQRWLGHADIKTTSIYTFVVGPEERLIAQRMWRTKRRPDRTEYEDSRLNAPAAKFDHALPLEAARPFDKHCLSVHNGTILLRGDLPVDIGDMKRPLDPFNHEHRIVTQSNLAIRSGAVIRQCLIAADAFGTVKNDLPLHLSGHSNRVPHFLEAPALVNVVLNLPLRQGP
ncbi:hypothetical protein M2336_003633 [Sphingobium sp. B1D7B]|uniref:tyrosine-type recombinase/integrase n=1 Tax=Sphingobium sp. B1D7B TaxID=2940578 RepID=UPI00222559D5|nr:site-specific integrase [Sphingobium sp. B1D7B]MCW2406949.1 hypothetical protein [Sphingobium sp. B1D7B]